MYSSKIFLLATLTCASLATAQMKQETLVPKGGEIFQVGTAMNIEWMGTKPIQKYDIYLSKDGGKTWPTSGEFVAGDSIRSSADGKFVYRWTPPASAATTQGRLRICQMSGGGGHCTVPGTYTIISPGNFTITTSSEVQASGMSNGTSLAYRTESRSVDIAFFLKESRNVSLEAFDAQGKLVATLLDGRKQPGSHRFSVFSNRLPSAGSLVFKLRLGDEVITQTWSGAN